MIFDTQLEISILENYIFTPSYRKILTLLERPSKIGIEKKNKWKNTNNV